MAGGLHSLTLKSLTSLSEYVLDHQPWPGYHGSLQIFWVRACLGQVPDLSFTRGQLYTQESLIQLCPTLPPPPLPNSRKEGWCWGLRWLGDKALQAEHHQQEGELQGNL